MLSSNLEKTLRNAYQLATSNKHEYVTLEHLLFALIDDEDASEVLLACIIDIEELWAILNDFITNELTALKLNKGEEVKPTTSFQRVIQRAANHVQMSGSEEVTGANILVAIFSERESHAVFYLNKQNMTRLDAVSYISHGSKSESVYEENLNQNAESGKTSKKKSIIEDQR